MNIRPRTRLNNICAGTMSGDDVSVVLYLQRDFTDSVFAFGYRTDLVVDEIQLDVNNLTDRLKGGINGAVAS